MNELEVKLGNEINLLDFIKSVFPDKEIREASNDGLAELSKLTIEFRLVLEKMYNKKNEQPNG